MMTAALIPAAGKGERLGKGPKAFLPLGDSSILQQTVLAFKGLVDEIIVAISEDMEKALSSHLETKVSIIKGGATRQESVYALINASQAEIVLIHDAARPFLAPEIIRASITSAEKYRAVSVVKTIADTLIKAEDGEAINRDLLRAVQTPQSFRRELILEAHQHARSKGIEATDDAALVRLLGHPVTLVEGNAWLDKITTAADYERAQALVTTWHKRGR